MLDAYIASDIAQESVNGANLWAMKAFFNPSPDCLAADENGHQIRIQETDATVLNGEDDQHLPAGGSVNFNDVRVVLDYPGTCEPFGAGVYLCLEIIRSPLAVPAFTLLGNTLTSEDAECRGKMLKKKKQQHEIHM